MAGCGAVIAPFVDVDWLGEGSPHSVFTALPVIALVALTMGAVLMQLGADDLRHPRLAIGASHLVVAAGGLMALMAVKNLVTWTRETGWVAGWGTWLLVVSGLLVAAGGGLAIRALREAA